MITVERVHETRARLLGQRDEELKLLATDDAFAIKRISPDLEDSYRSIAVLSFVGDADIAAFHHNMYLAARVRARLLTCVRQGLKIAPGFMLATYDRAIWEAVCSGHAGTIDELAGAKATTDVDPKLDNPYYYFFALGYRMCLLGKDDSARKMLGLFDGARKGALNGYSKLLHALLDRSQEEFDAGLLEAVTERRAEIEENQDAGVGEQWLYVEAIALARTGISRGLKLSDDVPLVPRELLGAVGGGFPDWERILPPIPTRFADLPPVEDRE